MDSWDSLFAEAKWKCQGSYTAQASIDYWAVLVLAGAFVAMACGTGEGCPQGDCSACQLDGRGGGDVPKDVRQDLGGQDSGGGDALSPPLCTGTSTFKLLSASSPQDWWVPPAGLLAYGMTLSSDDKWLFLSGWVDSDIEDSHLLVLGIEEDGAIGPVAGEVGEAPENCGPGVAEPIGVGMAMLPVMGGAQLLVSSTSDVDPGSEAFWGILYDVDPGTGALSGGTCVGPVAETAGRSGPVTKGGDVTAVYHHDDIGFVFGTDRGGVIVCSGCVGVGSCVCSELNGFWPDKAGRPVSSIIYLDSSELLVVGFAFGGGIGVYGVNESKKGGFWPLGEFDGAHSLHEEYGGDSILIGSPGGDALFAAGRLTLGQIVRVTGGAYASGPDRGETQPLDLLSLGVTTYRALSKAGGPGWVMDAALFAPDAGNAVWLVASSVDWTAAPGGEGEDSSRLVTGCVDWDSGEVKAVFAHVTADSCSNSNSSASGYYLPHVLAVSGNGKYVYSLHPWCNPMNALDRDVLFAHERVVAGP
ncbi:MAG: hypothetical protein FJ109_00775 [Deltaproteobacteria bacterium]|nr:hypothetical protein [Deltaproteobacteria bacterium]